MSQFNNQDLSRDEIRAQLLRNQTLPLPEYECVYRGPRIMPMSDEASVRLAAKLVGRRGTARRDESYAGWLARLDSKQWRVQLRGRREAQLVNRVTRISKGDARGFTEVPLNSRVV